MIVIAIIGILATLALASYSKSVARTNRSAVQTYLYGAASRAEQFLLDARQYPASLAALSFPTPAEVTGKYTVTFTPTNTATPPTYVITAVPTGAQATRDASCGTLTLNSSGTKTASGSSGVAGCW